MSIFDDYDEGGDNSDYSENDTLARANLMEFFRVKNWRFIAPRNPDSGSETSRDWLIALKKDGRPTAIEFAVQSKAIHSRKKLLKNSVIEEFDIQTIKDLAALSTRAAIHIYDRVNKKGYIRWVDEW